MIMTQFPYFSVGKLRVGSRIERTILLLALLPLTIVYGVHPSSAFVSLPFGSCSGSQDFAISSPLGQGFFLVAGPFFIAPGYAYSVTVSLSSINGFAGTIALGTTVPAYSSGLKTTASPARVDISAGGSALANVTFSATSATALGGYNVFLNATSG